MKSTIDDLKEILNTTDYPDVKFSLIAHKKDEGVIYENQLNPLDMWYHIYPSLVKSKLDDWMNTDFIDPDHIKGLIQGN